MRNAVIAAAGISLALAAGIAVQTQAPKPLDYETFCKLSDIPSKQSAFRETTAENRGILVRTHIERWRDANKSRLSEGQLAFLAEMITSITADTYADGAKGEEARQKVRPMAERAGQLFSREDNQAMQPNGPCIAK